MKIRELRQKKVEELKSTLQDKRSRVFELKWMLRQKKIKNSGELREAKKDIARILTLLANRPVA